MKSIDQLDIIECLRQSDESVKHREYLESFRLQVEEVFLLLTITLQTVTIPDSEGFRQQNEPRHQRVLSHDGDSQTRVRPVPEIQGP